MKERLVASIAPGVGLEALSLSLLGAIAVLGLAAAVVPALWARTGFLVTVAHEGSHALAAITARRRVLGIRVERDMSGSAEHVGPVGGIGAVWTTWWGYPGPAVLAAALMLATGHGYERAAVLALAVVATVLVLLSRSITTLAATVATAALAWWAWWSGGQIATGVAAGASVLLVVGAVRSVVALVGVHMPGRRAVESSDAHALWTMTLIPSPIWILTFIAAIAASGGYVTSVLSSVLV